MKKFKTRASAVAMALAASIPLLLTGCGANNSNAPGGVIQPLPGVVTPGVCIPIDLPINFSATNIHFDSANIRGGVLPADPSMGRPAPQQIGAVAISPAAGNMVGGGPYQRQGSDGVLSMNIVPINQVVAQAQPVGAAYYGGYQPQPQYYSGPANATGFLALNQLSQTDIIYSTGGWTNPGVVPQPIAPTTKPCVSGIAIDMGHYNYLLHSGIVYLYLNGTDHGYKVPF